MADPVEIAEGLSEAQRRAVIASVPGETHPYNLLNGRVRFILFNKRVLEYAVDQSGPYKPRFRLTPLGLAVRDHLKECESCGGLNLSCPEGCERDPKTGELVGALKGKPTPEGE